jgi:hypothetical protein
MSRRAWTGVVAGLLAASVLLAVGIGAYRAGQDHEIVTRTVTDGGEVVRVVGHGWGYGPGPGVFLFPLLGILLVVLLFRGLRGGPVGWGGPGGWGGGGGFDDWHRRAHEREQERDRSTA